MQSKSSTADVSSAELRLMLLRYGLSHPYRVVHLGEIADSLGRTDRVQLREGLEDLAREGLVTRFSGRYCFNRAIPPELASDGGTERVG
jgi:hypothetical protein